jgi:hypothetical protein
MQKQCDARAYRSMKFKLAGAEHRGRAVGALGQNRAPRGGPSLGGIVLERETIVE